MADEKSKDPETIPERDDLLFAGQVRPNQEDKSSDGCCSCTRKKLVIVAVVAIMLLLYGIGLAIGLAVGMSKNENDDSKDTKDDRVPIDVVVSDDAVCADIGRDILARHGTAVDAAIATLICNGVKTPHSMGIGGGCFMLIYDRYEEKVVTINGRETVPQYMTADNYKNLTDVNARRIAVPGELMAYQEAYLTHGRLPWRDLFEPTIKMIREGFPLSKSSANALEYIQTKHRQNFTNFPGLCNVFCSNPKTGEIKKAGDTIHWPKLADTLQGVADQGVDYLYESSLTQTIVDEIRAEGGVLSTDDFNWKYKVLRGEPVSIKVGNYTIYTMDGPTGGAVVGLIINILKGYKWSELSTLEEKVDFYHKMLEAFKFSDADRMKVGDPAFDNATWILEKMLSEEYANVLRTKITDKTHDKEYYSDATESWDTFMGTSHVSVLSSYGDAVSVTSTVNWYFGSLIMSDSTGIIWNNEMDDFDPIGKSDVNQIEPGKRPRSAMAPVIITDNDKNIKGVIGGAGGSYISTSVAQVLVKLLLLNRPLEEVIDDKRMHYKLNINKMVLEDGFPEDIKEKLTNDRGHVFTPYPANIFSVIESIYVEDVMKGYADGRKPSGKASYVYRLVDDIW